MPKKFPVPCLCRAPASSRGITAMQRKPVRSPGLTPAPPNPTRVLRLPSPPSFLHRPETRKGHFRKHQGSPAAPKCGHEGDRRPHFSGTSALPWILAPRAVASSFCSRPLGSCPWRRRAGARSPWGGAARSPRCCTEGGVTAHRGAEQPMRTDRTVNKGKK